MNTATVSEFRTHIKKYLDDVELKNESIVVLRGGKPIAEIVPIKTKTQKRTLPKPIRIGTSVTEALLENRASSRH